MEMLLKKKQCMFLHHTALLDKYSHHHWSKLLIKHSCLRLHQSQLQILLFFSRMIPLTMLQEYKNLHFSYRAFHTKQSDTHADDLGHSFQSQVLYQFCLQSQIQTHPVLQRHGMDFPWSALKHLCHISDWYESDYECQYHGYS